jgi:hypothetical protein
MLLILTPGLLCIRHHVESANVADRLCQHNETLGMTARTQHSRKLWEPHSGILRCYDPGRGTADAKDLFHRSRGAGGARQVLE